MSTTMTLGAFRQLTEGFVRHMTNRQAFSDDDLVAMVRVWNTIKERRLGDADPLFRSFLDRFAADYLAEAARRLDAQVSKGMSLYSRRHDLWIGGRPNANSQFALH